MLFEILPEIAEIDFANDNSSRKALRNLLLAVNSGRHAICADRKTLQQLVRILDRSSDLFDVDAKSTVKSALTKYSMQQGTFDKARYKIQIGKRGTGIQNSLPTTLPDIRRIPLDMLSVSSVDTATLLAENIVDCKLYRWAAKHYSLKNKIGNLELAIKLAIGGGSTIHTQFEEHKIQNTLCLCITDSDKFGPNASESFSSKSCKSLTSQSTWWLKHITTGDGRELENIIPRRIVGLALKKCGGEPLANWENLEDLLQALNKEEIYLYMDLKKGVTDKWLNKLKHPPIKSFWDAVVKELNQNQTIETISYCDDCKIESPKPSCTKCEVVRITGVAQKLAIRVDEWFNSLDIENSDEINELLNTCDDKSWLDVGEHVFWFSFAQRVKRS